MNDSQILEHLAATDAYASHVPLPESERIRNATFAQVERSVDMKTQSRLTPQTPSRRGRNGWLVAAATFAIVLVVGVTLALLTGQMNEPAAEPVTTTAPPIPTTAVSTPPEQVPPMVDAWQRVGGAVMGPVVGTFGMTEAGSRLIVVGFDPGDDNYRQNGVIFASDDGVKWVRLAEDDPALNLGAVLMYDVTEGGPGLVAVGMGCENEAEGCPPHATVWTSVDGTAWTRTPEDAAIFGDTATQTSAMTGVAATSHGLVAVGAMESWTLDEEGVEQLVTIHPTVWTSDDGITWARSWEGAGSALAPDAYREAYVGMDAVAEGADGRLVAVGGIIDDGGDWVAAVWVSNDARSWERIELNETVAGARTGMIEVTYGEDGFVAVGMDGGTDGADWQAAIWQSPDGIAWTRVDTSQQPFDGVDSLSSVAALDAGYVTVGSDGVFSDGPGWVTLWTSPDGATWDRVVSIGQGHASEVVVVDRGIAVSGGMPGADNFHAAVWAGPRLDPNAPPPEPPPSRVPVGDSEVDVTTVAGVDVSPGFEVFPPGDDFVAVDQGQRLPLGERTDLPATPRLDFLVSACDGPTCFRDANMIHPDDDQVGASTWVADAPFHTRHGFVNEETSSLGDDYEVAVFVTRREGPDLSDGSYPLNETYRFGSDFVTRGETSKCGPGYWEQTDSLTCEWFVHEFSDGLPPGRYDFWVGWYAPCSAWLDAGLVGSCVDPELVTWEFSSTVNMPFYSEEYAEGESPPYDVATILAGLLEGGGDPVNRGWPAD